MKQVNFITDLVEIKDKNIAFLKELTKIDDDFIYLFAILDYAPPVCPNCGGKCIRYGFRNFTHFIARIMLQKNIKTHSVRRKRHQINEVDFSYLSSD